MNNSNLVARVDINLSAPISKVWKYLTNPELIKQYLFGTEVQTDWKVGSPIVWKGIWEGKSYEDKGTILNFIPEKLLETSYWSSVSGLIDDPKNYKKVVYELFEENGLVMLVLTQDNNETEEAKEHSEGNWKMVLEGLKKLLEK